MGKKYIQVLVEENDLQEQEFDFKEIVQVFKKNLWIMIVISTFFALAGGIVSHFFITPKYEASINMIVNTRQNTMESVTNDNLTSAEKLVDTYAIIIKSNIVLNQVNEKLNLGKTYEALNAQVDVKAINDTQVMKITVKDIDVKQAEKIVQTIAEIAPPIIVDAVEAGSCKVISEIESDEAPVSPNTYRNVLMAGMLGLLLSFAIVIVKALLDDTIENESDVLRKLKIPTLGMIPDIEEK